MKLAHTMIRVKDVEATLDFYVNFIGLQEVRRKPIGDEATLIFLSDAAGSYTIELTHNHDGRDYELTSAPFPDADGNIHVLYRRLL